MRFRASRWGGDASGCRCPVAVRKRGWVAGDAGAWPGDEVGWCVGEELGVAGADSGWERKGPKWVRVVLGG